MPDRLNQLLKRLATGEQLRRLSQLRSCSEKLLAIEEKLFTERHLRFYASGVVAALLLACVLSWALNQADWVVRSDGSFSSTDFCWIWVTSKLAASGDPTRVFDNAMLEAAHNIYYRPNKCFYIPQFVYPPTFLFLIYLLGHTVFDCLYRLDGRHAPA